MRAQRERVQTEKLARAASVLAQETACVGVREGIMKEVGAARAAAALVRQRSEVRAPAHQRGNRRGLIPTAL